VDARSGRPIKGAVVRLDSALVLQFGPEDNLPPAATTLTTANGAFSIPPVKQWQIEPVPNLDPGDAGIICYVAIERARYATYRTNYPVRDATLFFPLPDINHLSRIDLQPLHQ
jgi:hypothetical protein